MLDLNFVRENLPLVEEKLRQRGMDPAAVLKDFREVDVCRRQAITGAETMKARRNQASEEIAKLKKAGQDASAQMAETKQLREQIQEKERAANELEVRLREILAGIPNIPHESVPVGKGTEDNVEVRRWGTPPKFDFIPKPHWELGEQLGVLDLERAAKLSGARFAVYWDLGARMERHGAPAHPGSLLFLARWQDLPVLGMPTCGMFSQATTFDLVLPRLLAGEAIANAEIAALGHGGLLSREMAYRFPPYRAGAARGELE